MCLVSMLTIAFVIFKMYKLWSRLFTAVTDKILFPRHLSTKMKPQIICILGSTGTGKSKLGIEIAQAIDGEIISADSMQVYKALDIVTNKVTFEEQNAVPHHMLSAIEPTQQFTVVDFRNKVLPLIDDLLNRNKSVIIVGGTYYYVAAILWKYLVSDQNETETSLLFERDSSLQKRTTVEFSSEHCDDNVQFNSIYQDNIDLVSNKTLSEHLMRIDPESAKKFHFNDRRRIIRALQIYEDSGNKLSDLLQLQHTEKGGCSDCGPLRFRNVKIFWLQCDADVLDKRLDDRVNDMLNRGLVDELLNFNRHYKQILPYTSGIFQSLGLKEFHDFLELDEIDTPEAHELLEKGINNLKIATRQYSRKQIQFIKNKYLRNPDRQLPPIYSLDTTNVDLWDEKVLKPALEIVNNSPENCSIQPLTRLEKLNNILDTFHCPECDVTVIGDHQFKIHMNSRKHKKRLLSLKKHDKIAQYKK